MRLKKKLKTMPLNFQTWQKTYTFRFNPNTTNSRKLTPKHRVLKILKTEDKGKIMKAVTKDKSNLTESSFSSENSEARRKKYNILKCEKKRNFKPKFYMQFKNIL